MKIDLNEYSKSILSFLTENNNENVNNASSEELPNDSKTSEPTEPTEPTESAQPSEPAEPNDRHTAFSTFKNEFIKLQDLIKGLSDIGLNTIEDIKKAAEEQTNTPAPVENATQANQSTQETSTSVPTQEAQPVTNTNQ